MSSLPFSHVTVIGLGLIGGSLAMAIKNRFPDVHLQAVDPHSEALQYALRGKIADEVSLTLPATFQDNHLIILACHLKPSLDILKQLAERITPEQDILVTDIGSCKRQICNLGKSLLPQQFIGGHPMAGREKSGVEHGTSLMFHDKRYILCPTNETNAETLERLEILIRGIGSIIKHLDADTHDRIMAYVSHFPQLYATMLAGLLKNNKPMQLMQYQGAGLDDQMRLAGSSHTMWKDVFEFNADNLSAVLAQFSNRIGQAEIQLQDEAPDFSDLFSDANEMYHTWLDFKQQRQQ